jgi:hypothetical protein
MLIESHTYAIILLTLRLTQAYRVTHALIATTRQHVPKWVGVILTVCLFIPGPLDEFLVLILIGVMVAVKPVMRRDLANAVRGAIA